jgi:mono/diheme cytochrome c family protein
MKLAQRFPAIAVSTVLLLGVGVVGWRFIAPSADSAAVAVKMPALSGQAAIGKRAYDANCIACHGANGAGSENGPPLIHDIYNPGHHPDVAFLAAARRGVPRHHWHFGNMPPQPQVKRDELAAIIRYVREVQEANGIFFKPHRM